MGFPPHHGPPKDPKPRCVPPVDRGFSYGSAMSDRIALAREIAARTKPRFIDTNPKRSQTLEACKALAREIAARSPARFIEIPRGRGVAFTEEELTRMRGGMSAEEYRFHMIRKFAKKKPRRGRFSRG